MIIELETKNGTARFDDRVNMKSDCFLKIMGEHMDCELSSDFVFLFNDVIENMKRTTRGTYTPHQLCKCWRAAGHTVTACK